MELNRYIDHTILKANARKEDIIKLCNEAVEYNFYSVCVNSSYVSLCKQVLKDSSIYITSVIGFPLGAMSTSAKIFETKKAIEDGADEIDMVINIGKFLDKDYEYVLDEINQIKELLPNKILKVIVETCYLNDEEIEKISEIVLKSNADYIKTSTGFGSRGASFNDIKIMDKVIKNKIKIKASGGIKTYEDALKYINMGVSRLGTSSGIALINKIEVEKNKY